MHFIAPPRSVQKCSLRVSYTSSSYQGFIQTKTCDQALHRSNRDVSAMSNSSEDNEFAVFQRCTNDRHGDMMKKDSTTTEKHENSTIIRIILSYRRTNLR